MIDFLRKLISSPWTNSLLAIILIVTSSAEVISELESPEFSPGSHHGVLTFGIFQLLKTLPEFFKSLEHTIVVAEAVKKKPSDEDFESHSKAS